MPEDKVPFVSHLTELRKRLVYVVAGIFVVFSVVFPLWADDIIRYFQAIAIIERKVGGTVIREQMKFVAVTPIESFGATVRVSIYAALVFAYPWGMLQLYLFVSPGLYRHERRFFKVAIPMIALLFVAGAAFGRYVLMPISLPFLMSFNIDELNLVQMFSLREYLNIVFALTFGLGFVFQIPLIVAPLVRFGLVNAEWIASKRRYTFFISIVIGALISPTGQPLDMFLSGLPVFFLLEGGTFVGKFWRKRALDKAAREIEVAAKDGRKIDLDSFGEGVSAELDERIKKFADEGARKFGRELMRAIRSGKQSVSSVFDDDFKDDDKPKQEVKLKPAESRRRKKAPEPTIEFDVETATNEAEPKADSEPETKPTEPTNETEPEATHDEEGGNDAEGTVGVSGSPWGGYAESHAEPETEEFPDRPWTDDFEEEQQRYIEDRISQRLEQLLDRELKPWMNRVDSQIKDMKNDGSDES
ncbi:twin-arginine translocase subunit TatC [Planctomycetota bacterium]|nr:twin-arginine translocase subunit TatC [Planctomycetota bacterium]